jgi:hypothetical protein
MNFASNVVAGQWRGVTLMQRQTASLALRPVDFLVGRLDGQVHLNLAANIK